MTVENVEINTAAVFARIQLPVPRTSRTAAPVNAGFLDAFKYCIEFIIADVKGIMMRLEGFGIIKVHRQLVVHPHWRKMTLRAIVIEAKKLREEFAAASLSFAGTIV